MYFILNFLIFCVVKVILNIVEWSMTQKKSTKQKIEMKIDDIIDKRIDKIVDQTLKELEKKEAYSTGESKKEKLEDVKVQNDIASEESLIENVQDNGQEKSTLRNSDFVKNKTLFAFSYLLFFLPLIWANNSPYKTFYANQGLVLFLTTIFATVIVSLTGLISVVLTWIFSIFLYVIIIAELLYGVLKTLQEEERVVLPVIGKINILK